MLVETWQENNIIVKKRLKTERMGRSWELGGVPFFRRLHFFAFAMVKADCDVYSM